MTDRDIERLAMVGYDAYRESAPARVANTRTWQELGGHEHELWLRMAAKVLNGEIERAAEMREARFEGYAPWSWEHVRLPYRRAWEAVRAAMLRARDGIWTTQKAA